MRRRRVEPQCKVCLHPKRHQIEVGLTHGIGLSVLAARFECSKYSIHRHGRHHLSPQQRTAILLGMREASPIDLAKLQINEGEGLLASLVMQRARLQSHSDLAMEMGDASAAISAERAIMSNLELVAKLLGQITQRTHSTSTSVLISADYLALRSAITTALRPFPEASRAVGTALHQLETQAAHDMTAAKLIEHSP